MPQLCGTFGGIDINFTITLLFTIRYSSSNIAFGPITSGELGWVQVFPKLLYPQQSLLTPFNHWERKKSHWLGVG